MCIIYSRTCNRKITGVRVEGEKRRCSRITKIITINIAAENVTGPRECSWGRNEGDGLEKSYTPRLRCTL